MPSICHVSGVVSRDPCCRVQRKFFALVPCRFKSLASRSHLVKPRARARPCMCVCRAPCARPSVLRDRSIANRVAVGRNIAPSTFLLERAHSLAHQFVFSFCAPSLVFRARDGIAQPIQAHGEEEAAWASTLAVNRGGCQPWQEVTPPLKTPRGQQR
jgi:hypothetical protein